MKIIPILRKRTVLATAGFLALVLAAAGLSLAWMGQPQCQLGGGWIGGGGGSVWNALYIPLDPAGQKAALRVNEISYGADTAGFLTAFGADALTEYVGEAQMISRNTWKWSMVCYGVKQGNPPEIRGIAVYTGTGTFTGVNSYDVNGSNAIYLPTADADGDGLPDPGATPVVTGPPSGGSAKRVPLP